MPDRSPLSLKELLMTGNSHELPKGQIIQSSDLRMVVNYLEKGFVKRYQVLPKETFSIQDIYGPGDVFPITLVYKDLLKQSIYDGDETYYYQAITKVRIHSMDAKLLAKAIDMTPNIYRDILSQAGRRLESHISRLENLAKRTSQAKIAHGLVLLARQFGVQWGSGFKILLPLTNQDMADILNVTRETVSANLSEFRKNKLVGGGRYMTVLDMKKLAKVAGS